jgi:hypothetical protein
MPPLEPVTQTELLPLAAVPPLGSISPFSITNPENPESIPSLSDLLELPELPTLPELPES